MSRVMPILCWCCVPRRRPRQLVKRRYDRGPVRGEGSCASRWREMTASTMLFRVDFVAPMEVKSQSMAWRVSEAMGRSLSVVARPTDHVRHEHQLRHALVRVPGALPRGQMLAVKAWLMAGTEVGVVAERRARTCSKLPCVWSRGEFVELFIRAARHRGGLPA